MVTEQDGTQTVSGTLLAADEVDPMLTFEAQLHHATGWNVRRWGQLCRFERGGSVRWVWVRARTPMEDVT